jgi:hypothetical protein
MSAPSSCTVQALNVAVVNLNSNASVTTSDSIEVRVLHATTQSQGQLAYSFGATAMYCYSTVGPPQNYGAIGSCSDTTDTFSVTQGDLLGLRFEETDISGAPNQVTVSLVCQ